MRQPRVETERSAGGPIRPRHLGPSAPNAAHHLDVDLAGRPPRRGRNFAAAVRRSLRGFRFRRGHGRGAGGPRHRPVLDEPDELRERQSSGCSSSWSSTRPRGCRVHVLESRWSRTAFPAAALTASAAWFLQLDTFSDGRSSRQAEMTYSVRSIPSARIFLSAVARVQRRQSPSRPHASRASKSGSTIAGVGRRRRCDTGQVSKVRSRPADPIARPHDHQPLDRCSAARARCPAR